MKLLAIDTSTELASVALMVGSELSYKEQTNQRSHAQFILPMIEQLLGDAELSLTQLDAIVFGRGPGSFTGLRIACSVAKGLAFAHDLGVIPVSSLSAIAFQAREEAKNPSLPVLAVIDARMHELYWGYYLTGQLDTSEQVTPAGQLNVATKNPFVLAGVGIDLYWQEISSELKSHIHSQFSIYPHALSMVRIAEQEGISPINAVDAQPIYVRNQVTQGGSGG